MAVKRATLEAENTRLSVEVERLTQQHRVLMERDACHVERLNAFEQGNTPLMELRAGFEMVVATMRYHTHRECQKRKAPLHDRDGCMSALYSLAEELYELIRASFPTAGPPPASDNAPEGGQLK